MSDAKLTSISNTMQNSLLNDLHKKHPYKIASAEKFGATAKAEHIVDAIQAALKKASLDSASSVLLFLTNGYTQDLKNTLKIAAKASGTIQVYGATAVGLLTDKQWILDHEGAVAMVFPEECDLQPANLLDAQGKLNSTLPLICLSSPEQSKVAINHSKWGKQHIFGAITSNAYGISEYPIWQASRIVKDGFLHANFHTHSTLNLRAHTIVSQGIRRISGNLLINKAKDNCITKVAKKTPLKNIQEAIPSHMYPLFLEQPYHTLCAVSEATQTNNDDEGPLNALSKDFYRLFNIVGIDEEQQSIYLSGKVKEKQHCFWSLRDNTIAKQEWNNSLKQLSDSIENPAFAILFCSESRGPYFHGGNEDIDLELYKKYFPNTPLIGIYSSGEITKGAYFQSLLRRYSSALTLYTF